MSKLDEIVYSHIGADVTTFNGVKVVNLSDHRVPSEQVKENIKDLIRELMADTITELLAKDSTSTSDYINILQKKVEAL